MSVMSKNWTILYIDLRDQVYLTNIDLGAVNMY